MNENRCNISGKLRVLLYYVHKRELKSISNDICINVWWFNFFFLRCNLIRLLSKTLYTSMVTKCTLVYSYISIKEFIVISIRLKYMPNNLYSFGRQPRNWFAVWYDGNNIMVVTGRTYIDYSPSKITVS